VLYAPEGIKEFFNFIQSFSAPLISNSSSNNSAKILHSNIIYDKWLQRTTKGIFSRRLGVAYRTQFLANRRSNPLGSDYRPMYQKQFSNLEIKYSNKPSIKHKQEKRLERLKSRLYQLGNLMRLQHLKSIQKGYLLVPTKSVVKRISHLNYKKQQSEPSYPSDYPFNVPFFALSLPTQSNMLDI
jgi:hypothetical protein